MPSNAAPVLRLQNALSADQAAAWDALLAQQSQPTPFMQHAYLQALHDSHSACPQTGWRPLWCCLYANEEEAAPLLAACLLYVKAHSRGEYVFDWAWADAYTQHGLRYYPKALLAVPFTPVPGNRLLASDAASRQTLLQGLLQWCEQQGLSSLHMLFAADEDLEAAQALGLMLRHTVQFHWHNQTPASMEAAPRPYRDFDDFLSSLNQEKRKKIRQERRRVAQAGVTFEVRQGAAIRPEDWEFFYHCYQQTYYEHGNPPYLQPAFFQAMATQMSQHWVLFIAQRGGQRIACSLVALSADGRTAYGRYWGALERVDCLHFEACYYQPLEWCIAQGVASFEGGAQGEHKMARALLPSPTSSAHWLAHPAFADAVQEFLQQEGQRVQHYLTHLETRSPLRQA